ncbi:MAG: hypothetical protein V4609_10030 [Pseudomonadota bacterium]
MRTRQSVPPRKYAFLVAAGLLAAMLPGLSAAQAQQRIYRCGNTYTNDAVEAQAKGCKPMDGGNFTVIEGTRVNAPARPAAAAAPQAGASAQQRIDASAQRARDADARLILETELKNAESRHQELLKEYNNGEPERLGSERNYQKYLDRVAELKAAIARNEADIAGIRRELSRQTSTR